MDIRVSLQRAANYDLEKVDLALAAALKPFGGIGAFVSPGQKVLLKVNALMPANPKRAVSTNPAVVAAVAKAVLMVGATPIIGDSPGGPYQPKLLETTYRATGMWDLAERLGIEVNLDCSSFDLIYPDGRLSKRFQVIQPVQECDVLINISKLKTHGFMMYTGAVKNLFGVIPGMAKAEYHLKMSAEADFATMLVDLCEAVTPTLSIMDGIIAMEGDGPSGGKPRTMEAILVSANPHALDLAACGLIGLTPQQVPTLQEAVNRGLVPHDVTQLELLGEPLSSLAVKDFLLPKHRVRRTRKTKPQHSISKILAEYMKPKPVFSKRRCTRCGRCAESCPPQCLILDSKVPQVDMKRCIRCFCCHELCPRQAVRIVRPMLARWFFSR